MQQPCYPGPPPFPAHAYPPFAPLPSYGSYYNSGNNTNGSGIQTNGSVKVGNSKEKSGGIDIGTIGGNHTNSGGQQTSGNTVVGDISG